MPVEPAGVADVQVVGRGQRAQPRHGQRGPLAGAEPEADEVLEGGQARWPTAQCVPPRNQPRAPASRRGSGSARPARTWSRLPVGGPLPTKLVMRERRAGVHHVQPAVEGRPVDRMRVRLSTAGSWISSVPPSNVIAAPGPPRCTSPLWTSRRPLMMLPVCVLVPVSVHVPEAQLAQHAVARDGAGEGRVVRDDHRERRVGDHDRAADVARQPRHRGAGAQRGQGSRLVDAAGMGHIHIVSVAAPALAKRPSGPRGGRRASATVPVRG
jgi:hypothetical protein